VSSIDIKCEQNCGIITINKPQIHNALALDDIFKICSTVESWQKLSLSAIVLTGKGQSFCSGLYIEELKDRKWRENPISVLCEKIENSKFPTICGLNGSVYGGGVEIALSCDFRVAYSDLALAIPAVKLGIHYEPKGILRALRIFGPSLSRRLFLLGETAYFEDLKKTSFADFWVDESNKVSVITKELVEILKGNAPLALKGMKKTFNDLERSSISALNADSRIQACFDSEDHKEALKARSEKRNPVFRGR